MPKSQKRNSHVYIRFIDYKPAELRIGKDWIIVYYAKHPINNDLERFRLRVPAMKSSPERKRFAKNLLAEINRKLESGWSPFLEESGKGFKTVDEVIKLFISNLEKEGKEGVKRIDTIRTYGSYLAIFKLYITTKNTVKFVADMNRAFVVNYLDYIYNDRGNSAVSFNNHLNFIGVFCNWLIDRGYLAENPAKGIQRKKQAEKTRKIIPPAARKIIAEKLPEWNCNYFNLCMCTYYGFIRGTELTKIRVSNIDLENRSILIPSDNSKNKKTEMVTIPEPLHELLQNHLKNAEPQWFVFSGENFAPGSLQLKPKKIRDTWANFRKQIGLPIEYQFYSLKDTGITELLRTGIAAVKVKHQARHSEIKITELYLQKYQGTEDEIKNSNERF